MSTLSITTSVYKYKPYAPWIIGGYCVLLVTLFMVSAQLPALIVGICAAILLSIPIYAAIKPKSIFSVRSVDDRKLLINKESIIWDGMTMLIKDVSELSIYLFSFDNFRHEELGASGLRTTTTEDGDKNKLNFVFGGKEYDFTFYIGNFSQYQIMLKIIKAWQDAGYEVSARSAFDYSYIQKEVEFYTKRNKL